MSSVKDAMSFLFGDTANPARSTEKISPVYIGGAPKKVSEEDLDVYITNASKETGVPKSYIRAIIERENAGLISNISWKGVPGANSTATGLGQFLDSTAEEVGITDSTDPEQSVKGTARYLKKHLDSNNGDFGKAAMRYIGGTDALGTTPGSYSDDVMGYQKKFAQIYGETGTEYQATPESAPVNRGIGSGPDIREQVKGILGSNKSPVNNIGKGVEDARNFLFGPQDTVQVDSTVQQPVAPVEPPVEQKQPRQELNKPGPIGEAISENVETVDPNKKLGIPFVGDAVNMIKNIGGSVLRTAQFPFKLKGEQIETKKKLSSELRAELSGKEEISLTDPIYKKIIKVVDPGTISTFENNGVIKTKDIIGVFDKFDEGYKTEENLREVNKQIVTTIDSALESKVLKEDEVKRLGGALGVAQDITGVVTQVLAQVGVTMAYPPAGIAMITSQIGGNTLKVLDENGISAQEAAPLMLVNVGAQSWLEKYSIGKLISIAKKSSTSVLRKLAQGMAVEGATEAPQQLPDEILGQMWADTKGKTLGEKIEYYKANWKTLAKNAGYAGFLGMFGGAAGTGLAIGVQKLNEKPKGIGQQPIETLVPEGPLAPEGPTPPVEQPIGTPAPSDVTIENIQSGLTQKMPVTSEMKIEPIPEGAFDNIPEEKRQVARNISDRMANIDRMVKGAASEQEIKKEMVDGGFLKDYGVTQTNDLNRTLREVDKNDLPYTLVSADIGNMKRANTLAKTNQEADEKYLKPVFGDVWATEVRRNGGIPFRNLGTGDELYEVYIGKTKAEVEVVRAKIEEAIRAKRDELGLTEEVNPRNDLPTGALHTEYSVVEGIKGKYGETIKEADLKLTRDRKAKEIAFAEEKGYTLNEKTGKFEKIIPEVSDVGSSKTEEVGNKPEVAPQGTVKNPEQDGSGPGSKETAEEVTPKVEEVVPQKVEKPAEVPVAKKEEPKKEKFTGINESGVYVEGVEEIDIRLPEVLKTTAKIRLVKKQNGKWTTGRLFNDARQFKYKNIDGAPNKDGKEYDTREEAIQAEVDNGIAFFKHNGNKEAAKLLKDYGEKQKPVEKPAEAKKEESIPEGAVTKEYDTAHEKYTEASKKYRQLTSDYRSKKIGDTEYLNGRRDFENAQKEFDRAEKEAKEEPVPEMIETEITPTKGGLVGKEVKGEKYSTRTMELIQDAINAEYPENQRTGFRNKIQQYANENKPTDKDLVEHAVKSFPRIKSRVPLYGKEQNEEESTNVLKEDTKESILKEKTKEQRIAEARERFNKKQKPKEGEVSGKGKPEQRPADDVGAVDRGGAKSGEGAGKEGDAGKRTEGEGGDVSPGGRRDGDAGTTPARSPRNSPREPVGGRGGKARGDVGGDTGPGLTESQKKRQELLKKLGKSITGEDLSAEIGVPQELTDEQKGIAFDLVASTITDENLKDFQSVAKDVKSLAGGYTQDPLFQKAIEDAYDAFAEDPDNGVSVRKVSFSAVINPSKPKPKALINYLIENADNIGEGGPEQKTNDNIEAIRILKQIESEERFATEEEQQQLVKYVGWGALANVFNNGNKAYRQDLRDLLTDAEYADARGSTQNAHYTSPGIIQQIWNAVLRFGFNGGNVLEPGLGIGHFYGLRPSINMAMEGVEMDSITGRIARQLYQGADIRVQPYETVKMPKDYYTLEISNVPFSKNSPVEPTEVKTPGLEGKPSLHNFYFLKSLYGLKPGGVLAFITTHYTMDAATNSDIRAQMVKNADFLGAIRLPETAFKKNAGTQVVTDIIFMQKRAEGQQPSPMNALFVNTQDVEYDAPKAGGKKTVQVSNYFINKPEMVMGAQNLNGTMRGLGDNYTVQYSGEDLMASVSKAIENLPQNIMAKHVEIETDKAEKNLFKDMNSIQKMPLGSYFVRDGVTYQIDFETGKPKRAKGNTEIIGRLAVLKEKVLDMYFNQRNTEGYDIKAPLAEVNNLYDNFVKNHGPIAKNIKHFEDDSFKSLLQSLENYDDETGKAIKSDLLKGVTFEKEHTIETTNSTQEAVIVSLNTFGGLNIPHIAKMLGVEQQQAADMLLADKLVFKSAEDFLNGGRLVYKTRDEYLSGNVREKFETAKKAALKDRSFGINVSELEAIIPLDKTPAQITIRMNSPILQTEDVKDFLKTIYQGGEISVSHEFGMGKWNVDIRLPNHREDEYATSRMSGEKIINVLMRSGRPEVYDTVEDATGKETKVLNEEESAKAQVKADEITKLFKEWLWTDEVRTTRLVRRFNDEFNSTLNRDYVHPSRVIDPEAKIRFPGSAFPYPARKHQSDVIWRVLQSRNTLLAHEVGSGKTLEMIWAGMEAKRLGLIKKPCYVFPNHMLKQWTNNFLEAYPNARILVAGEKDLKPANRRLFINRIATGNWDAVLIKREDFKSIPLSPKETSEQLQVMSDRFSDFIETLRNEDKDGNRITIKQLEAQRDSFDARIQDLQNKAKKEQGTLYFEDLGIDMLFVDEADQYKNLNYYTSLKKTKGLGTQKGSGRALNMYFKTQYMNKKEQRIVFATGTPIANSLVESYSMMRYLQKDWLEEHGIESFDDWNRMFTEAVTDLELDNTGTSYKPTTRFKKIVHVPSFIKALREVWDIKNGDYLREENILVPGRDLPHNKTINVTAPATDLMKSFKRYLVRREEDLAGKKVRKGADNVLVIINDGQKAALDLRLFNPSLPDMPESKLNMVTNNVLDIYKKYDKQKYTQLVFLNNARSYSKDPHGDRKVLFDGIADMMKKLVAGGIKPEEVVDFSQKKYKSDDAKEALFKAVRSGKVRVLIGSVEKMGAGTNVQTLVKAIHQPNAPWNPRDIEQSNGRGIRQGNKVLDYDENGNRTTPEGECGTVEIYNYATKGSLDTGIWGLLETKSKVIKTIMKADPDSLADEIEEEYFGSVKELSIEDPIMKEAVGLRHRVKELETLAKVHLSSVSKAKSEIKAIPNWIKGVEERIKLFEKDIARREPEKKGEDFSMTVDGKTYDKRKDAGKALMDVIEANEKKFNEEVKKGNFLPQKTLGIGSYAGFPIRVVSEDGTNMAGNKLLISRVEAVGKFNYVGSLNPDTRNPEGLIQSLHIALYKSMNEKLQSEKDHITELERSKEVNQKQIDKPFAEAQELQEKKERKAEVEKILSTHVAPHVRLEDEPVNWEMMRIFHDTDNSDKGDVREGDKDEEDNDEEEASMGIPEAKFFEPEEFEAPVTPEPKKMKAQDSFKPGAGKGKRLGYAVASKKTGDHISSEPSKKNKGTDFLSGVEKFYSQWKSETFPIQKLGKMAEKESGLKLEDAERLDFKIEKVWGAAGATKVLIDEQLKPIYGRIKKNGGEIYDEANKYMVAKRTVDLYENEAKGYIDAGYGIETATQMVEFVESGTHKYSEEILRVAEGVWGFGQKLRDIRLEHGIIDDNLWALLDEQHYVPFLRDHKDVESKGAHVYGGTKFTSTNKGIMRIKGSTTGAKIIDPIQSLIKQAYETVENAARVDVANAVIDLSEKYPGIGEMIKELPPKWIKAKSIEHRMEVDLVLRPQMDAMVEALGGSVEYKGKLAGRMGGRMKKVMGLFKDDAIKLLAGSTEGTYAHEMGHLINSKREWLNDFVEKYDPEMNAVADSRFQGQEVPISFVRYVRKPSEKIAEFISMYVTDRNTLKEIAPQAMAEFEDRISNDDILKDLIEMAPSNASGIKSVEENNFILDRTVPTDEDVVSLLRGGKVKSYRMPIEAATAMKNLHPAQLPGWIKLLSIPSQMVRAGAVGLNVDFFIPNVFRDQIDAAFNSNLIPFYDALGGLKSYLSKDKYYRQYLAEGGSMESAEAGTDGLKTSAAQVQYGSNLGKFADPYYWKSEGVLKGLGSAGYYVLKSPFAGLMELGKISEMTTRLATYRAGLKKGLSVSKSVHQARQASLEFNNIGSQMRTLNQLVPFTNVSFEGLDRMARTLRDSPKSSMLKVMIYMIAPLTALWFWNRDEEDYKLVSVREKLNNWIIMMKDGKGGYWKIPKAHITKFVINPIQMALEKQLGYVQKSALGIAGDVLQNINPADFGSMPPVIRMIWEPIANYDFYWRKEIEKPTLRNIQIPGMRFNQKTNELMKVIGKALNISPIMMQHELELLGAGFAKNTFWVADVLMGDLEKEKQVSEFTPIARRFSGRLTDWNSDIDYSIRDIDKILQGMQKVSKKALKKNYGFENKEMRELVNKQAQMKFKLLKKKAELIKAKQAIKTLNKNNLESN